MNESQGSHGGDFTNAGFFSDGPEDRGNPLDAVMNDHELYEIITKSGDHDYEVAGADTLRRLYFGMLDIQRGLLAEMRLRVANVRTIPDAVRTIDTFALALGHTTVCGAKCSADLARKWGKKRETINKPLLEIIEKFKLPRLPGMRDDEGVENITNGRNEHKKTK